MDTTNVKLTAGQINDLPKPDEPFQYIAPIDYLTAAYICNGKISSVSDINDFISRNEDFADIIQKKIAFLIDTGAMSVSADGSIEIDPNIQSWSPFDSPEKSLKTVPDLVSALSKRALLERIKAPQNGANFSFVVDFPDTEEINKLIARASLDFHNKMVEISKYAEGQGMKSDKVRGVTLSSGILAEEDFS